MSVVSFCRICQLNCKVDQDVSVISTCGHVYHSSCIRQWRLTGSNPNSPFSRRRLNGGVQTSGPMSGMTCCTTGVVIKLFIQTRERESPPDAVAHEEEGASGVNPRIRLLEQIVDSLQNDLEAALDPASESSEDDEATSAELKEEKDRLMREFFRTIFPNKDFDTLTEEEKGHLITIAEFCGNFAKGKESAEMTKNSIRAAISECTVSDEIISGDDGGYGFEHTDGEN